MYDDFDIQEELKKLPDKPGVYIMHDASDDIIYVGKAVILKNRVRQYFQSSRNHTEKIKRMVSNVKRFEYIITDSELEALVLECNLIKEHRPRYNTMLKDDKGYPYIKVTTHEVYPRILFVREMKRDKCKYFGPFTSPKAVHDTIDLLQKTYGIRTCNRNLPKDACKARPCLNYHIGQCKAPCQNYISPEDYAVNVNNALEFLQGKYSKILNELQRKMEEYSEKMEFEKAAEYRDLLTSVKMVAQKQKITNSDMQDKDIIAAAIDKEDCVIQVFFVREGRLIGREHYHMRLAEDETMPQIFTKFIKQFYSGIPFIPATIMIQEDPEEKELLEQWLAQKRGQSVRITIPKRGTKEKLVELAEKNAQMVLDQDRDKIKKEELRTVGAVKAIQNMLNLSDLHRMEAFDISNISGAQPVGSMVVFMDGKSKRNDYRKFRIKTVVGPDDYSSMREVLTRRFTHEGDGSFDSFPDLILMDGGRGQVNIALEVLDALSLDIPVCGMVKDDNHRTRGIYYNNQEIAIDRNSEEFKLITRIQDEAHRFAITFHRNLRSSEQVKSILDEIEGVGPARRKNLMKHFKDIDAVKKASVDELCQAPSITEAVANNIYRFLHSKD